MFEFELLTKSHDRQKFDSGNLAINQYLQKMANQHDKKGISKTHILTNNHKNIVGFYTLSNTSFDNREHWVKNYPNQIPAVLIGRMGVDLAFQGQSLSKKLLLSALKNVKKLSHTSGIAFAVIEAKDKKLAEYYQRIGFFRINDSLTLLYDMRNITN